MKKTFKFAAMIFVAAILFSCKNKETNEFVQINAAGEINRLQAENERLIRENESLKNGEISETKMRGKIEYNFALKNYELTKAYIITFIDLFPTSSRIAQFQTYYDLIESEEKEIKAAEREHEIAELQSTSADYTGIWKIKNFTDQNGNETNVSYITISEPLSGTYSDISFDAASFKADFIIKAKNDISLMIYEGNSEEPLKGSTKTPLKYTVKITDSKGTSFSFTAKNTSDRINFGSTFSNKLHSALLLGGTVKFELSTTRDSYAVKYNFQIPNAQFYNTACRLKGIL